MWRPRRCDFFTVIPRRAKREPGMTKLIASPARYYNSREIGMAVFRNVHVRTRSNR
jgi:hypothetical protein